MIEQKPDGSERRTGIFIAVALLVLAVPCFAAVALIGVGAVMFYRLSETPLPINSPPDVAVSPSLSIVPVAPPPIAQPVQPGP